MGTRFRERLRVGRFASARLGALAVSLAVITVATTTSFGEAPIRSPRAPQAFQHHAAGAPALVDQTWTIDLGDGWPMGLITGAAICGDDVFFVELVQGLVHKISLAQLRRVATFGDPRTRVLHNPVAIASDCAGLLYIVEQHFVTVMDADSGAILRRLPKPFTFVNAPGIATFDPASSSLFVQGLWTPRKSDWLDKRLDEMYEGDMIGYSMNALTGATAPVVGSVERGCWSSTPNCLVGLVEKVRTPAPAAWLAAHSVGTAIGVFDSSKRLLRTIDVRSPQFEEDGRRVTRRAAGIEAKFAWQERNSVIRALYSFDDTVVTIHSVNATRGWKTGGQIDFNVLMNIHGLDGTGIASDLKLDDLPVGRDDDNIYVLDYGHGGRRRLGHAPVTLMRIPIRGRWS